VCGWRYYQILEKSIDGALHDSRVRRNSNGPERAPARASYEQRDMKRWRCCAVCRQLGSSLDHRAFFAIAMFRRLAAQPSNIGASSLANRSGIYRPRLLVNQSLDMEAFRVPKTYCLTTTKGRPQARRVRIPSRAMEMLVQRGTPPWKAIA